MKKKLVIALICVEMLLSLLPASVLAAQYTFSSLNSGQALQADDVIYNDISDAVTIYYGDAEVFRVQPGESATLGANADSVNTFASFTVSMKQYAWTELTGVTASTPTVTSIIIVPNPGGAVEKGGTETFRAYVIGVGGTSDIAQTVIWSVSGNTSANTSITNGVLSVGSDETAASISVTATSTVDTTKSETSVVIVREPARYEIIAGANGKFLKNAPADLKFTANDFNFNSVTVDGVAVPYSSLINNEGSADVSLKADYLNTLSTGNHTFRFIYPNGYAETTFTVEGSNPKTGDSAYAAVTALLSLVLLAGISLYMGKTRKENR